MMFQKFCGNIKKNKKKKKSVRCTPPQKDQKIVSSMNSVTLFFRSDGSFTRKGFLLQWRMF